MASNNSVCSRPQFGNRFLTDESRTFEHNAWDNIEWDEEREMDARNQVAAKSTVIISADKQETFIKEADFHWDKFYKIHQDRFFKDRHWLFTEFPELSNSCNVTHEEKFSAKSENLFNILEVGCGAGNTVLPILQTNNNRNLILFCCDFSSEAVALVKSHPDFDSDRCNAFVWDITEDSCSVPVSDASLDVIIMIFVLSAIHPNKMQMAIKNLVQYLKPGGIVLFRDYGRYDMAQLRFKSGRCLGDNLYVRGDGTTVYFFTQEDVHRLFSESGLTKEQNFVDRRLQVNRGKLKKMYRVWIQAKYRKAS